MEQNGKIKAPFIITFFILVIAIPYETVTAKFRFLSLVSFAPKSHDI